MLLPLLAGAALAGPPQLGLAVGPVVGGGTSTYGDYFSAAPALTATITWHLGPFESWIGASGSGLMAGYGDRVIPAALLEGEVGVGFGAPGAGAGFYGGNGFPGPILGLYGRATLPGDGWMRRIGVETRLFHTAVTDSTGFALLLRVEPGFDREPRPSRRPPGPRPPPGPPPPYPDARADEAAPAPSADSPPPGEEPSVVIPAGSAPPGSDEAPADDAKKSTHHEEPY